ncbi:Asp23/Gls24 family envelope stress response protein [Arthrobacter livingstonensis]|uniref:Asp23/Gls24 family envelope stress response protein n=1 Tax=Arthrobacter livingstonensis TaxID=670078 RepID=A0A2V5LDY5_9MICC|nr:Asp23/Gls24 family envelope stress response protein [Arthrobacter livingstonensis]PYI69915.1 Asp23/Gls24 family envelope stress response protein [Arthrobacter livingstonensis]
MTTQPQGKTPATVQATATKPAASTTATGRGTTTVADGVVAKVAGIAAQDIAGVYALGGGAARALGTLREAVGQRDLTQGVSVEVGQTQVAVDVTLVVEYPHPLQKVADNVRDAIYAAVEDVVGMEVTEVNVSITDIHISGDEPEEKQAEDSRVDTRNIDDAVEPRTREARVS